MYPFVIPLIFCIVIFILVSIFIPKKISGYEIYATVFLSLFLTQLVDMIFDIGLDLFGYGLRGVDFWGVTAEIIFNPSGGIIMMNYYPFEGNFKRKFLYIFLCSIGCIAFEWIAIKLGFFYHNGWGLWISALFYPFLVFILSINIYFVRKII